MKNLELENELLKEALLRAVTLVEQGKKLMGEDESLEKDTQANEFLKMAKELPLGDNTTPLSMGQFLMKSMSL